MVNQPAYYPKFSMYPYWLADFLTDPRVIHNVPFTLRQTAQRERAIASTSLEQVLAQQPNLVLSFDIERDMSQPFESEVSFTAAPFIEELLRLVQNTDLKITFFVQGALVPKLKTQLNSVVKAGHELGLHGYNHELWGRTNWITRRSPLTVAERERRLEKALLNFEEAGLPKPLAFRAPNFTIDKDTYRLLANYGFKVDSSLPTQRGNLFHFDSFCGIRRVPVTCAPLPQIYYHPRLKLATAAHFSQFNFDTYVKKQASQLSTLAEKSLRFQLSKNIRPNIVMYAHNWEFYPKAEVPKNSASTTCETLVSNSLYLKQCFEMKSVTLSELAYSIDSR